MIEASLRADVPAAPSWPVALLWPPLRLAPLPMTAALTYYGGSRTIVDGHAISRREYG
jgi:hypothetical protein